ncbi:hypothetical protein [Neobacillus drentensis]|uniref:hypothetical protein n=1 Tax=Neobacillus drentensis TaxID=220684 RepID=UPI003003A19E
MLDYCIAREYWEEAEIIKKNEEQMELVIQKKLAPSVVGLNDDYFRRNPSKASIVSRSYHLDQNSSTEMRATSETKQETSDIAIGCVTLIAIAAVVILIMYKFIF